MFTGIIQSIGSIENINNKKNTYLIKTDLDLSDCIVGDSICCDGVCLTAVDIIKKNLDYYFSVNVGEETIKKSNLFEWDLENKVNIEKSLKVGDSLSGHFVYGHVDTTLKLKEVIKLKNSWEFEFSFLGAEGKKNLKKYIVEKGSLAINGISLTVAQVLESSLIISIIPHTFNNTNLANLKLNSLVNIEIDPLARYIGNRYE